MVALSLTSNTLVIVLDEVTDEQLEALAEQQQWQLAHHPDLSACMKLMRQWRPRVVLIQAMEETMMERAEQLITQLRVHWQGVKILAIGAADDIAMEIAMRSAGVAAYFAGPVDQNLVHRHVKALAVPVQSQRNSLSLSLSTSSRRAAG